MQSEKYQNKYRVQSTRLPDWDYRSSGFYFITICTNGQICCLGDILVEDDGEPSAVLSDIGKIAQECWMEIPKHFNNVWLDEWIVMPNHIHGIIQICENQPHDKIVETQHDKIVETQHDKIVETQHDKIVETQHAASLQDKKPSRTFYRLQPESLSVIMRSFKSVVTNECHNRNFDFTWQPRFWDHIIRTETTLRKIREYIRFNPLKWQFDRENPGGLWM